MPKLRPSAAARRAAARRREERRELVRTLSDTRAQIQQAYSGFNNARDGELIDSYVFEISALQSRYNYLLRRMKETEGTE